MVNKWLAGWAALASWHPVNVGMKGIAGRDEKGEKEQLSQKMQEWRPVEPTGKPM